MRTFGGWQNPNFVDKFSFSLTNQFHVNGTADTNGKKKRNQCYKNKLQILIMWSFDQRLLWPTCE
jgi:hypothetical protein